MSELTLFDLEPFEDPTWTRTTMHDGSTFEWHHRAGGLVQHCGHPTALWPWAVWDHEGNPVRHPGGRLTWRSAREAKAEIERRAA